MQIALIDVSNYVFKHVFATMAWYRYKKQEKYTKKLLKTVEFRNSLVKNLWTKLEKMKKKIGSVQCTVWCCDGKLSKTWRYRVYPKYKQNRKKSEHSDLFKLCYDEIMEFCKKEAQHLFFKISSVEADDLIATLAIQHTKVFQYYNYNGTVVVVSEDSDFHQLPSYSSVRLLNVSLQEIEISKQKSKDILQEKIITGDACDNILSSKKNCVQLNTQLIDFRFIPENVELLIMKKYREMFKTTSSKRNIILSSKGWVRAIVLSRPSKKVRSPYLADIKVGEKTAMAHSACLGMSGMITCGSHVWVSAIDKEKKLKSQYRIELVEDKNTLVGAQPLKANQIFEYAIKKKWIFSKIKIKHFQAEFCFMKSRFDFYFHDGVNHHLVEVKNVVLCNDRVAYFPDGYRKPGTTTISERAVRQIKELNEWSKKSNHISHLIFIIQREDADYFEINKKDKVLSNVIFNSVANNTICLSQYRVTWNEKGCTGFKSVPCFWF